jgi:hypothetical protein
MNDSCCATVGDVGNRRVAARRRREVANIATEGADSDALIEEIRGEDP